MNEVESELTRRLQYKETPPEYYANSQDKMTLGSHSKSSITTTKDQTSEDCLKSVLKHQSKDVPIVNAHSMEVNNYRENIKENTNVTDKGQLMVNQSDITNTNKSEPRKCKLLLPV